MLKRMVASYCLLWSSACLSIEEWKGIAVIIATYVALPGALFAAFKTFVEIRRLREERARERLSRIHGQQLESLRRLYENLDSVQAYAQRMTSSAILEGEQVDRYPELLASALGTARQVFTSARLLLPASLVEKIETYFNKVVEGQVQLGVAQRIVWGGAEREAYWKKAASIAHQELPVLLSAIEGSARAIIHGEERPVSETGA
jgi:hypothetical protein